MEVCWGCRIIPQNNNIFRKDWVAIYIQPHGIVVHGVVIIPTAPGCQYAICAGCAACCYSNDAGPTALPGCQSYVTGYNLCNFCADGGDSSPYCYLIRARGSADGYCVIQNYTNGTLNKNPKGTSYGWCMCSGGGFCWNAQCSGNDCLPFVTSTKTYYGCVPTPTKCCHFVIGAPGIFNAVNGLSGYQNEICKYLFHPPIVNQTCGCCGALMRAGSTDAGCCYVPASGYLQYWGRGGWPSSVAGGCNNCGGGVGSGGAVCVQYTTDL